MNKKIILVGSGNIGSRHLQSLTKLPYDTDIEIIEPNTNSQKIAQTRLSEMDFDSSKFSFDWKNSIENVSEGDLVILATPSNKRLELFEILLEKGNSRFLIEKMACQSETEYKKIQTLLEKYNAKCWLNTSRRYYHAYTLLKKLFGEKTNFSIIGGNIGLGSNAIHYVDLFSWFTNDYQIKLNGDFLYDEIFPSKRGESFSEFAGVISGINSKNSSFYINSIPQSNIPITVRIFDNENDIIIDETNEKIFNYRGNLKIDFDFKIDPQSILTLKMASDIFKDDRCDLPMFYDSYITHTELFRIFNDQIEKITNEQVEKCPIT